jgi:hypothetical protein
MKIKNLLNLLAALLLLGVNSYGQSVVSDVFNSSASGTTSATVILPESNDFGNVTDLAWKLDAGLTTGFVAIQAGQNRHPVTSATASAASVLWFNNVGNDSSGFDVSAYEYLIFFDKSTSTYYLRRTNAAATTSVTLQASISVTTVVTDDAVWSTYAAVEKPIIGSTSATVGSGLGNIWIPAKAPTAFTIDGNTTACRISVSGVRARAR